MTLQKEKAPAVKLPLSTAENLGVGLPKYRSEGGPGGFASGRTLRRVLAAKQRKEAKR